MTDNIEVVAAQPEPTVDAPAAETPKTEAENTGAATQADAPASEDHATADEKPDGDEPKDGKKPRGWVSTRINELTREKHEARREAEEARAAKVRLEAELDMLRRGTVQPSAPEATTAATPASFDPFDPASVAAFVSQQADERSRAAIAAERARWEQEVRTKTFQARVQEFQGKIGETNEGALRLLHDTSAPVTDDMAEFIMDSPDGVTVADYLGQNYAEAARIASLPPVQRGIELGRLEARLRQPQPASPPPVKPSNAPAPPPTVGARAAASVNPDAMSVKDFEAWLLPRLSG